MAFYHQQILRIFVITFIFAATTTLAIEKTAQQQVQNGRVTLNEPEGRALFNPRIEYNNQWTPVGHSDPLNNDPTFDYSPPSLDHVRYWAESDVNDDDNKNSNNMNEKSEILLLGVPTKHTLSPHNHPKQMDQIEAKLSNRRSSPYYPPEPSRVLTPPPIQSHPLLSDQISYASDYNLQTSYTNYWGSETPPYHYSNDAFVDESANHVTVIKPKTIPSPYLATSPSVYKDARNSIYSFAANVNSLEMSNKKKPWLQSLLQKEVNYQPQSTTPQVVLAYSPHIFEAHSTHLSNSISKNEPQKQTAIETSTQFTPTTLPPITLTTDELFSHYKQPVVPMVRGPMYLIIQGHSKVKTYGAESAGNVTHQPKMVPVKANKDPIVAHVVSEDDHGNAIQVKHLHKTQSAEIKVKSASKQNKKVANSTMDSLLSLLDNSFAGFFFGDGESKAKPIFKSKQSSSSVTEVKHDATNTSTIRSVHSLIVAPTTINPLSSVNLENSTSHDIS